jgi:hypothetical protein
MLDVSSYCIGVLKERRDMDTEEKSQVIRAMLDCLDCSSVSPSDEEGFRFIYAVMKAAI